MTSGGNGLKRAIILLGLGLIAGCGSAGPTRQSEPAAQPTPPVTVAVVDYDSLHERIAGHRGTVVVLDCWSTSCPPCVKEFPGLVALQNDYGDQVACLSLSFDYEGFGQLDEILPPVQAFLEQVGAHAVENLISRDDADTLYAKFGLDSVPAAFVWDRAGKQVARFDDTLAREQLGRPFTYADVRQAVEQALAPQPTPDPEKEQG